MGGRLLAVVSLAGLAAIAAVSLGAPALGQDSASDRLYVTQVKLTGKGKPRGDPNGIGTVTVCVNRTNNSISYGFEQLLLNVRPTAGHIHRGAAGATGPVVFPFEAPGPIDPLIGDVQWFGTGKAPKGTVEALVTSPGKHYVNVHTKKFPNGAIRGQVGAWRTVQPDDPSAAVCGSG
jgi:CHRD domain-containing protein